MLTFVFYTANAVPEHLGVPGRPRELPGGRAQARGKWAAGSPQLPKDLLGREVSVFWVFLVELRVFFFPVCHTEKKRTHNLNNFT